MLSTFGELRGFRVQGLGFRKLCLLNPELWTLVPDYFAPVLPTFFLSFSSE